VVDASVALAWCLPDEQSDFAVRIISGLKPGESFLVPAVWVVEVANGLLMAERRNRNIQGADQYLRALSVDILAMDLESALSPVAELARRHNLTIYDAAYVHAAKANALPLATLDERLRVAARAEGCAVLG
jgi:predicted nucleic acid-binding protein